MNLQKPVDDLMRNKYDCVIIGGGQAGIFAAKTAADRGLKYIVIEKQKIGDVWRNRLEGMHLFTSSQFCGLPEVPFPGDPESFPSVIEMAEYLTLYSQNMKINVLENVGVEKVEKKNSNFHISLSNGEKLNSTAVINATGANQKPIIPLYAENLDKHVQQFDASISSLDHIQAGKKVVVVGDGATGRQIAGRLADKCHVSLSTGSKRALPSNTLFGKDIFWWLTKIGILFSDKKSIVAKILKKRNPVPCGDFNNRNLKKLGVQIIPRIVDSRDNTLISQDGSITEAEIVIWAIGYREVTDWLHIPHCVSNDSFQEDYGRTPEPGLFVVGRKWLTCRASELVMGVEKDVSRIMVYLDDYLAKENQ